MRFWKKKGETFRVAIVCDGERRERDGKDFTLCNERIMCSFMQKERIVVKILNVFQLFWMPNSLLFECTTILTQKPDKT